MVRSRDSAWSLGCYGYGSTIGKPHEYFDRYCQVEAFRADPTPRYWQRRALKPVLCQNSALLK